MLCFVAGRAAAPARGRYLRGSVLQVALVATGFVVPAMFFLGLLFGALWFLGSHLGRKVERLEAGAARAGRGASDVPGRRVASRCTTVTLPSERWS